MFDPVKAAKAQAEYCEKNEMPNFASYNGTCWRCGRNIYLPINGSGGKIFGYTVEEAGKRLITGCPHCNATFCD